MGGICIEEHAAQTVTNIHHVGDVIAKELARRVFFSSPQEPIKVLESVSSPPSPKKHSMCETYLINKAVQGYIIRKVEEICKRIEETERSFSSYSHDWVMTSQLARIGTISQQFGDLTREFNYAGYLSTLQNWGWGFMEM